MIFKRCASCKIEKQLLDFYRDKNGKHGVFLYCKLCDDARRKIYIAKNPNYAKEKHLRQRFKLSIEKRNKLIQEQNGRCKICGTSDPGKRGWQIDHDHECCPTRKKTCGKCIRGILCISCNKGLGDFKDSSNLLKAAALYLENSKKKGKE